MKRSHKIALGAALGLSVIAVGGAVGATQLTPREESRAVINDAARQLGIEPNELSEALEQALKNRVDDAVEDGRLTEQEGERMKERIEAGDVPFFGPGPAFHRHHGPFHSKLDAAAEYLGMSQAQLREALEGGKTLAQIARDRDKSVDGLVEALVTRAEQKLDDAVEDGRLTEAEKQDMLSGLRERLRDMVNGRFPAHPPGFRHRIEPPEPRPGFFDETGETGSPRGKRVLRAADAPSPGGRHVRKGSV
jgi:polyhydroxyalkanoate synthesis regulator phasin